jgi:tetratricopeptide (TPR) repeat protein
MAPRFTVPVVSHSILCLIVAVAVGCAKDPHTAMLKFAKKGDAFASAGKLPEAIIEYRNAIQQEPRAGDVRVKLGDLYVRHGELAKAIEEYVRAADVLAGADVQLKAGNMLLAARRFDDAKARAEKALAADPKNVEAQILLANALAGLKDLDGAVTELEQAIQLEPERGATYSSLGAMELGRGHRDAAEKAFKRAVALGPQKAQPHLALASFYWATARWPDAEEELTAALTAEPDNPLAHRTAAAFYLATKRSGRAEEHLRRVFDITKTPDAAITVADYYVSQNREDAARRLLEPLAKDPKTAAAANIRLAVLDQATGHPAEAKDRLESVIKSDPRQLTALLIKSGFLLKDGKTEEAVSVAKSAVEAHPDSPAAFSALGRAQMARKDVDAAAAAYREAVRLNPLATDAKMALSRLELASGRAASSVTLADDALKTQPQNADARLLLVKALISSGQLARAQTELDVLSAQFPDSAALHVQRGMLLGRKQQPVEARREFERALQQEPGALEASAGLVALDLSAHRTDEARGRVDALVKDPAAKTPAVMLAARTYAALGDLKTSEQMLRRVIAQDASDLSAYAALGQIYAKQGRLDAALVELDTLIRRDPKAVAALTLSGMILEAQGKTKDAQARFERVMQVDQTAPVAANNLAWLYAENGGNLDVALQLAQTASRKLPDTPEVNDTLGYIYLKKNLPALAIPPLRASTEKDPANALYQYHLGLAYAKSGESERGRQALTRALSLKPDFEGAQDARSVLGSLAPRQ